ncbi:uncharacterized protein LOC141607296 [Silene latifolia]|uniref:uncharacterized protein LOC141607296 n=1 Tax=Silene latifolia TaxID=37657 RepID=UPI003D76F986
MGAFPFRYLGLPLFNARITQDMYQPLLDKIKARIMNWANHCLSYAGKALLVNSVIFGLHNFWGASVLLPKGIAKRIIKLCKDFFWGVAEGTRRHVFLKWQLLCSPKLEGGIGIKEVLSWNCAQMMKWVWKLFHRPHCIWAKWISTYVLKGACVWDAQQTVSNSWYWNNVLKMKNLLLEIAGSPSQALLLLDACTVQTRYSTDTMYGHIRARRQKVYWAPLIHGKGCNPKHSVTGVMVMQDGLPTVDKLISRGMCFVNRCALCERSCEDIPHLFFNCEFSKQVLNAVGSWVLMPLESFSLDSLMQAVLPTRSNVMVHTSLLATIYYLWKERNDRIFKGSKSTVETLSIVIRKVVTLRLYGSTFS